jgi:hypothetical protein
VQHGQKDRALDREFELAVGQQVLDHRSVSSISLFDGLPITEIDGLPTSASQVL